MELGCGTGLGAVEFARDGFDVIALEPSEQMLEVARGGCRGDNVRWIPGGVSAHDIRGVDMVFMAGHVAQFFLADDEWREVITAARAMLAPGGLFAFESRNPLARAWELWTPRETRRTVVDPAVGPIDTWTVVDTVSDGFLTTVQHYRFAASGDELTARTVLRFRSLEELEHRCAQAASPSSVVTAVGTASRSRVTTRR